MSNNYIRPAPPANYVDAWKGNLGQSVNNNKVVAGLGLKVKHGADGTHLSVADELDQVALNYAGVYSFSSSYEPNDVVFVDPSLVYHNQSGVVIPPSPATGSTLGICYGLFVCTRFVPPFGYDNTYLTGSIVPAYTTAGQSISGGFADTFRLYPYNCYYPIFPLIPTSSLTTASFSGVSVTANINFWAPLTPYIQTTACINGSAVTMYVAGYVSGSVFNISQLPYSG